MVCGKEEHFRLSGKVVISSYKAHFGAFRLDTAASLILTPPPHRGSEGGEQQESTGPLIQRASASFDLEIRLSRERLPVPALGSPGSASNSKLSGLSAFLSIAFQHENFKCMLMIFLLEFYFNPPKFVNKSSSPPTLHSHLRSLRPAVPSPVTSEAQAFRRGTGNVYGGQPGAQGGGRGGGGGGRRSLGAEGQVVRRTRKRLADASPPLCAGEKSSPLLEE